MGEARARSGRLGLACDGRQHVDGEHECGRRFWPQARGRTSWTDVDEIRGRAGLQGWYFGPHARTGELVDLCPYHAPAAAAFDRLAIAEKS